MQNLIHTHDDWRTVDYRCDRRELNNSTAAVKSGSSSDLLGRKAGRFILPISPEAN